MLVVPTFVSFFFSGCFVDMAIIDIQTSFFSLHLLVAWTAGARTSNDPTIAGEWRAQKF